MFEPEPEPRTPELEPGTEPEIEHELSSENREV